MKLKRSDLPGYIPPVVISQAEWADAVNAIHSLRFDLDAVKSQSGTGVPTPTPTPRPEDDIARRLDELEAAVQALKRRVDVLACFP